MRYIEVELGDVVLSVPAGIADYLEQDERPQWWRAALHSACLDEECGWRLSGYLEARGVDLRRAADGCPVVSSLRHALLEEYRGTWREEI